MATELKFSTAGFRGVLGQSVTAQNIQKLSSAIADHIFGDSFYAFEGEGYQRYIKDRGLKFRRPLVLVGADTRFMSNELADVVCDTLTAKGIIVRRAQNPLPTPVAEWAVLKEGAVGAVVITASEADYLQNGLKWISFYGGIANNEVVAEIEQKVVNIPASREVIEYGHKNSAVAIQNFRDEYLQHLMGLINVKAIKKAKLKVGIDPIFGTADGYFRKFLTLCGGVEIFGINEGRDVLFGGKVPNAGPVSLSDLSELVVKKKLHLGIACNSDCDKFGIIGPDGKWLSPNQIAPILLEHIITRRKQEGRVCRSLITTHLIDDVAKAYNLSVRETPVGFKYINELMMTGQYVFGAEESGGIALAGHIPDKDGILACLLVLEMIAMSGKSLTQLFKEFYKKFKPSYDQKVSIPKRAIEISQIMNKLNIKPPLSINNTSVWRIDQSDGFKFIFKNGAWLSLRPSGTENLIRIYAEAKDEKTPSILIAEAKKLIEKLSK